MIIYIYIYVYIYIIDFTSIPKLYSQPFFTSMIPPVFSSKKSALGTEIFCVLASKIGVRLQFGWLN